MSPGDGVALGAEVFGEVVFHDEGGFEGHGVVHFVKFGEQADAEEFDGAGGFGSVFVVGEALFRRQSAHADVNAGLFRIAAGIGGADFGQVHRFGREQDDVHVVMMGGGGGGFYFAEGAAAHVSPRM